MPWLLKVTNFPRAAMVNVKPNLQIIADDVKCSHGCAVSDLEEEQLFYFRSALCNLIHHAAVHRDRLSFLALA